MTKVDKKFNFLKPIKNPNLIRLGRNHDGGYVIDSSIIKKCNTLISFGLGSDWSFELEYIKRNKNVKIYLYDHTVSAYPYIKDILKYGKRFLTLRSKYKDVLIRLKYLNDYNRFLKSKNIIFFKEEITFPSDSRKKADIHKVFSRIETDEEVILKVDIEGSEYKIINQIKMFSKKIKMIIIEFHWINQNENSFIDSVKMLKENFDIIHVHGNNHHGKLKSGIPIVLEMTFLNKNYTSDYNNEYVNNFPLAGLDYPCNLYKEDLTFSFE